MSVGHVIEAAATRLADRRPRAADEAAVDTIWRIVEATAAGRTILGGASESLVEAWRNDGPYDAFTPERERVAFQTWCRLAATARTSALVGEAAVVLRKLLADVADPAEAIWNAIASAAADDPNGSWVPLNPAGRALAAAMAEHRPGEHVPLWARSVISQRDIQHCRMCGCTNERACNGGCTWVRPDLCSACDSYTVRAMHAASTVDEIAAFPAAESAGVLDVAVAKLVTDDRWRRSAPDHPEARDLIWQVIEAAAEGNTRPIEETMAGQALRDAWTAAHPNTPYAVDAFLAWCERVELDREAVNGPTDVPAPLYGEWGDEPAGEIVVDVPLSDVNRVRMGFSSVDEMQAVRDKLTHEINARTGAADAPWRALLVVAVEMHPDTQHEWTPATIAGYLERVIAGDDEVAGVAVAFQHGTDLVLFEDGYGGLELPRRGRGRGTMQPFSAATASGEPANPDYSVDLRPSTGDLVDSDVGERQDVRGDDVGVPRLGYATTGELLDELAARADLGTVDGQPYSRSGRDHIVTLLGDVKEGLAKLDPTALAFRPANPPSPYDNEPPF